MGLFEENPQREVPRDHKVVVFDLETRRSFDEVGGRSQFHRLGVSVGVAYRYDSDEFLVFDQFVHSGRYREQSFAEFKAANS